MAACYTRSCDCLHCAAGIEGCGGVLRRGTGRCRRRGRLALGLQPSAAPASAGWGSGDPPAPAVSVYVSVFFCISLCSYAGLSNRVTERSSAVRGCRAALSHRVQTVCCLSSCCTLLFSFFLHIHLIADFRFFDAWLLIIRAFSSWFCLFFPT